jgi:ATP-dependent Lhr-like helicase
MHRSGFWVPATLTTVQRLYRDAVLEPSIESFEIGGPEDRESAAVEVVRGWMESTGPMTATQMSERLAIPRELIDVALGRLEATGEILRGRFTPKAREANAELEWCNRRILARIHRLTIGRLRREIEPVSSADFMRFLFSWQHVAQGTQLHGVDGVFQILKQLQGYEISASSWETEVQPRRIARYTPEMLDQQALSGKSWEDCRRTRPLPSLWKRLPAAGAYERAAPGFTSSAEDATWLLQPPATPISRCRIPPARF